MMSACGCSSCTTTATTAYMAAPSRLLPRAIQARSVACICHQLDLDAHPEGMSTTHSRKRSA